LIANNLAWSDSKRGGFNGESTFYCGESRYGNASGGTVKEIVALGAKSALNGAEVAQAFDVVITMLPNSPHVKEVVLGKNGVIEGLRRGRSA
jgi:hypothetical protein